MCVAIPTRNLFLAGCCIVGSVAAMVYTAKMLYDSICEECANKSAELLSLSESLQKASADLALYAKELDERSQKILMEENASTIGEYGRRIEELVAMIDTTGSDDY